MHRRYISISDLICIKFVLPVLYAYIVVACCPMLLLGRIFVFIYLFMYDFCSTILYYFTIGNNLLLFLIL